MIWRSVEDISHILIWGEPAGDSHRITSVELPRLKLRFSQQEHEDGEAYLHLTDASEWFLTDYYGNPDVEDVTLQYERESIVALVSGLPHSLLLQNKADEFQVLLFNHDVTGLWSRVCHFLQSLFLTVVLCHGKKSWRGVSTLCQSTLLSHF